MPVHWLLLRLAQIHEDPAGCPGGYTAPEEIGVFRPDRTADCQCRRHYWPILWIPVAQPFPRRALKIAVNFAPDQVYQAAERTQEPERLVRIAAAF